MAGRGRDLDSFDIAILSALCENPRLTSVELSSFVHLSRTSVSRRITSLRDRGAFLERADIVSFPTLGFDIDATVELATPFNSSPRTTADILEMPEVLSVSTTTGNKNLLLRVVAVDMPHFQRFIKNLQRFGSTSTNLVISTETSKIRLVDRLAAIRNQGRHEKRCG